MRRDDLNEARRGIGDALRSSESTPLRVPKVAGGGAPEKFRFIIAQAKGAVAAGAATFTVDTVTAIAGGLSPTSDPADELTVDLALADYPDDAWVMACYDPSSPNSWFDVTPHIQPWTLVRAQVATSSVTAGQATFGVENVVLLAGTRDPGATLTANDALGDYSVGQKVFLVYDDEAAEWIDMTPNGTSSGAPEQYRLITGLTTAAVLASDASMVIDNVEEVANGLDPTPDVSTTVTVYRPAQDYPSGRRVYAWHSPATGEAGPWIDCTPFEQRATLIRGTVMTSSVTAGQVSFAIENVVLLAGCVDIIGATDEAAVNDALADYEVGDKIFAVWDDENLEFIDITPSGSGIGSSEIVTVRVDTSVPAIVDNTPTAVEGAGKLMSIAETVPGNNVWELTAGATITLVNTSKSTVTANGVAFDLYWQAVKLRDAVGDDPNAAYLLIAPTELRSLPDFDVASSSQVPKNDFDLVSWVDTSPCVDA